MSTQAFDIVIACLFPLFLLIVGYRLRNEFFSWADLKALLTGASSAVSGAPDYYSLKRAYHSYLQFLSLSYNETKRMRNSYGSVGRLHKNIGHKIGYPQRIERAWKSASLNALLTEDIASLAAREYTHLPSSPKIQANSADLARVRESLKHFVRDWSEAASLERQRTFSPILNLLRRVDPEKRGKLRVLNPGSGLGRLAWEISELGQLACLLHQKSD